MAQMKHSNKHKTSNIDFDDEVMRLATLLKFEAITAADYQQQMLGLMRMVPQKFLVQDVSRAKRDGRLAALGDQFNKVAGMRLYGTERFWQFIRGGLTHQELTLVLLGIAAQIKIAVAKGETHGEFRLRQEGGHKARQIDVNFEHVWAVGAPLPKSTCVICAADEDIRSVFQSGQEGTELYAKRQARLLETDLGCHPIEPTTVAIRLQPAKVRV